MNSNKTQIRRYLSIPKFISLLEYGALYFTRSDRFEDPLDGTYLNDTDPKGTFIRDSTEVRMEKTDHPIAMSRIGGQKVRNLSQKFREIIVVNCWVKGSTESVAMWSQYCGIDGGVAIESTIKDLQNSIDYKLKPQPVIKTVKYLDYTVEEPPSNNILDPYFHKRIAFDSEKEIRVVIALLHLENSPPKHGIYIPVDLFRLIKIVHISPKAPGWFTELVIKILHRYKLDSEVKKSTLFMKKK